MANTLKLEIVTPDAKVFSEDVDMVTLPGVEGEMGIYPQHVPLLTQIVAGEIIARKGMAHEAIGRARRHRSFRAIARRHTERNERIGAVMGERAVFRRVVP